ncbi:MAG: transcriptional regulator FtsR [Acidimicrobiales bacterium]
MVDRSHLSIGEVLSLLQEEFPDVTISKIRFLESQGLLDPERTPSGYRKFYEPDVDRLRWILHQQKDNFLPLKVIKDRLRESERRGVPVESLDRPMPAIVPSADDTVPVATQPVPSAGAEAGAGAPPRHARDAAATSVSLTRHELAATAGLSDDDVADLERFGVIAGRAAGKDTYFDGDAVVVARAAAGFLKYGIEARHLRMYKMAAEREAGFFEQVILPVLKQRNPTARQRAIDTLDDLARLGERLHGTLLRQSLGRYTSQG